VRNSAFLALGVLLLVLQSNLFRLLDLLPVPVATPSLLLPLVLFMGVHEYSVGRGAALAFLLGYLLDVFAAAPVGPFTFPSGGTFVFATDHRGRTLAEVPARLDKGAHGSGGFRLTEQNAMHAARQDLAKLPCVKAYNLG